MQCGGVGLDDYDSMDAGLCRIAKVLVGIEGKVWRQKSGQL